MSEEEMQRKMEFIIEQQAKFTIDIQLLQEAHAQAEKRMSNLEKGFVGLYNMMSDTAKLQQANAAQIEANAAQIEKNAAQIAALADAQKRTDERVNAFIVVLEQEISARQNKGARRKTTAKKFRSAAKKRSGK